MRGTMQPPTCSHSLSQILRSRQIIPCLHGKAEPTDSATTRGTMHHHQVLHPLLKSSEAVTSFASSMDFLLEDQQARMEEHLGKGMRVRSARSFG